MPIGTPKVPVHRFKKKVFIPLYERLQEDRIIFICKNLEFPLVNRVIGLILYMNAEEDDTDISLYINSHGGGALSAMALYDTMEFISVDICTVDIGLAASAASVILVAGTNPKRLAFPHARIMIHQPSTRYFCGTADFILMETERMSQLRNTIAEIYAQKTGQPINVIQNDLERDTFMSAKEAQDYGIIDRIAIKKKKEPYRNLDHFF
nr:clp protease proteolytic subunit [Bolboschoenus planiculmis]